MFEGGAGGNHIKNQRAKIKIVVSPGATEFSENASGSLPAGRQVNSKLHSFFPGMVSPDCHVELSKVFLEFKGHALPSFLAISSSSITPKVGFLLPMKELRSTSFGSPLST